MNLLAGFILGTLAVANNEAEIQRALIQRDQQSAEFAARVRGEDVSRLQQLHARQLQEPMPPEAPLPLPGGPRHGVDPIPAQRIGD